MSSVHAPSRDGSPQPGYPSRDDGVTCLSSPDDGDPSVADVAVTASDIAPRSDETGRANAYALARMMFPTAAICISAAARTGLADALAAGPLTADALARRTGTSRTELVKILRRLAEDGVFTETGPEVFANTALSELLRPAAPGSQHDMARLVGESWLWRSWGALAENLRTGRPGFEHEHGETLWAYLAGHPVAGSVFSGAMTSFSEAMSAPVVAALPGFAGGSVVADLGGGHGVFVSTLLDAVPAVARGILVDLPAVIEQARSHPAVDRLVADGRLDLVAGDFFDGVPGGVDAYVMKQVMHSWDDSRVRALLERCRSASPGARIVAAEFVQEAGAPRFVKDFDLVMTITMGGGVRSREQYAAVFADAGYRLTGVLPTGTPFSLIEAEPIVGTDATPGGTP